MFLACLEHAKSAIQEQGMGGTVYDRDTIMKKYMGGYDGMTLLILLSGYHRWLWLIASEHDGVGCHLTM